MFGGIGKAIGGMFGHSRNSSTNSPLAQLLMQRQGLPQGGMMGGGMMGGMGGGIAADAPFQGQKPNYNTGIMKPSTLTGGISQLPPEGMGSPVSTGMPINEGGGAIDESGADVPQGPSPYANVGSAIGSMMGGMGVKPQASLGSAIGGMMGGMGVKPQSSMGGAMGAVRNSFNPYRR